LISPRAVSRRKAAVTLAVAVLPVVALTAYTAGTSNANADRTVARNATPDRTAGAGEGSLAQFLHDHPRLNKRSMALAFVKEKSGGEASGELASGPSQEQYDNRALPRKVIATAQEASSRSAYAQAVVRGASPQGQQAQAAAAGQAAAQSWTLLGPAGGQVPAQVTYTGTPTVVSGRTTSLAISNRCTGTTCTVYAGTAGGGVWKTVNALAARPDWRPIGQSIPSNAIGKVYLAPDGSLYVGTGEPNGSGDSEAGVGLFRSTNGGSSFTKVGTQVAAGDFARGRGIGAIVVDPRNPRHVFVGTTVARHGSSSANGGRFTPPGSAKVGLFETTNGGSTWARVLTRPSDPVDPTSPTGSDYFRGGVTRVALDPNNPAIVYASVNSYGLFRRSANGTWQRIYGVTYAGDPGLSIYSRVEFDIAKLAGGKTRIYLGDATYYYDPNVGFTSGFLRTDDAATGNPSWKTLSNATKGTPGYGSYNFCEAQCTYDMKVTARPGQPNSVYLSGSMQYDEIFTANRPSNGRAVIRSTDAGVHFTDMTNDAQRRPNGLHPDQHDLVFVPGSRTEMFITASDGGMVRQSGPFVDRSSQCNSRGLSGADLTDCRMFLKAIPTFNTEINSGLSTLLFQSVSVGQQDALQAGTQDNGTFETDLKRGWFESVGGDGGQSGFNPKTNSIRYHSYYAPQHDVNFRGNDPAGWDWISDRLLASGEAASFYTPFMADPVNAGYVYDGLQHIWRTTDNGGSRAFLDKHCNELTGDFTKLCGDFVPLGGAKGDLSGPAYGSDNADTSNYVVAIERATTNKNTMWAATRRGRVFLSNNANAAPAAVNYTRLDKALHLPARFVSGISIDPSNPYHAWLSYSGYSAYSPGGHVYEVRWNPQTHSGTATNLSYDLGDQPITDIVHNERTGALYASNDFGVLALSRGSHSWVATQGLPKVATYGLTLKPNGAFLYAATHGRSIWRLRVS